jgi:hypothetical protein
MVAVLAGAEAVRIKVPGAPATAKAEVCCTAATTIWADEVALVPPRLEQVSPKVYVPGVVRLLDVVNEPPLGETVVPAHAPLAVQEVAFEDVQLRVADVPGVIVTGLVPPFTSRVAVTCCCGATTIRTDEAGLVPPGPEHVRVNV